MLAETGVPASGFERRSEGMTAISKAHALLVQAGRTLVRLVVYVNTNFCTLVQFRRIISREFTREKYRANDVRLVALFERPEHCALVPKLLAVDNPGS